MKARVPFEVQMVHGMLVLLCVMLGVFMVSVANRFMLGGILSVLAMDALVRYMIKCVKKC